MEKVLEMSERPSQQQEGALSLADLPDAIHRRCSSFLSIGGRASLAFALSGTSRSFNEFQVPEQVVNKMRAIMMGDPSSENDSMECDVSDEDSTECEVSYENIDLDCREEWYDVTHDAEICDEFFRYRARRTLGDGHLDAFLRSIDARNTVESITVSDASCAWRIRGKGLEPFRGSTALKKIDLHGAGELSKRKVLSVLRSIVAAPNNSLRHVQFPTSWLKKRDDTLVEFMIFFNQNRGSRSLPCSSKTCTDDACLSQFCTQRSRGNISFGTITLTCYSCLSVYCDDYCVDEESSSDERLRQCAACFRTSCNVCSNFDEYEEWRECDGCDGRFCSHCSEGPSTRRCSNGECAFGSRFKYCDLCKRTYMVETGDGFFCCSECWLASLREDRRRFWLEEDEECDCPPIRRLPWQKSVSDFFPSLGRKKDT